MVEQLSALFDRMGVDWILWLLLALSVTSIAVMIERLWFFQQNKSCYQTISDALKAAFSERNFDKARQVVGVQRGLAALVVNQALEDVPKGPAAIEDSVRSAIGRERLRYDKRLSFLGTLGNNAPFIGLFGTVLGVISAFQDLGSQLQSTDASRNEALMGSIAEALVATAVGLLVAIPAVIAFNYFKGSIRKRIGEAESLSSQLLAGLRGAEHIDKPGA